jgi:hypothetical protein
LDLLIIGAACNTFFRNLQELADGLFQSAGRLHKGADAGSLTSASRTLGLSLASVGREIAVWKIISATNSSFAGRGL